MINWILANHIPEWVVLVLPSLFVVAAMCLHKLLLGTWFHAETFTEKAIRSLRQEGLWPADE